MVFVKVRETYDLHTVKNKMTVIAIHTPKPDIIKRNYPGLLMQCRAYRPVSADVRIACASVLPLDPLGVGTTSNDVAPEDVFNPILYKAISNKGMSQLEARIQTISIGGSGVDVTGETAAVEVDGTTSMTDEFNLYYGLLAETHNWKHANPQQGLEMLGLKPYVYEMVYNMGDMSEPFDPRSSGHLTTSIAKGPAADLSGQVVLPARAVLGKAKEFPFLNCTSWTQYNSGGSVVANTESPAGFAGLTYPSYNCEQDVPYLPVVCGACIIPPSRLHELYYRMVVEWTLEFSSIRSMAEIQNWYGLSHMGETSHYQNYSYSSAKEAVTGTDETILKNDSCMVSANVDVNKVM